MKQNVCDAFAGLNHHPLQIFRESKTPAGLYARQKWLNESGTEKWQSDFEATLHALLSGQSDDGSWQQSSLETVRRLFGLHLTRRHPTEEIEKALEWLMRQTLDHGSLDLTAPVAALSPADFRGLPFMPGQTRVSVVCMTLFLATVFQKGHESDVLAHYRLLSLWVSQHADAAESEADKSNALRALVVHPDYADSPAAAALVSQLEQIREPSGCGSDAMLFFRTLNALAHLRLEQANRPWSKAQEILYRTQSSDGAWSGEDREWNTFLAVHALKNKGCL